MIVSQANKSLPESRKTQKNAHACFTLQFYDFLFTRSIILSVVLAFF